jgi:hypothetical protein
VRGYGIGLIAAGVGALAAASLGGDALVSSLATTASTEPVVRHVWTIATPLLREAAGATIGYGLVMFLGAWLAGPSRPAFAIRRALAPYLREPLVAWSAFAVIAIVVLWWGPTPALRNPLTALLLIALLALGYEGLRRRTAREFPDASWDEALRDHGRRIVRMRERVAPADSGNGAPPAPPAPPAAREPASAD